MGSPKTLKVSGTNGNLRVAIDLPVALPFCDPVDIITMAGKTKSLVPVAIHAIVESIQDVKKFDMSTKYSAISFR